MQGVGVEQKKEGEGEKKVTNNCDTTSSTIPVNSDLKSEKAMDTSSNMELLPEKSGQITDANNSEASDPLANLHNEGSLDVTSADDNNGDDIVEAGIADPDSPIDPPRKTKISFRPSDYNLCKDDPL